MDKPITTKKRRLFNAYLIKPVDVTFGDDIKPVCFDIDTPIKVDIETNICYIDIYMVKINRNSYNLVC